MSPAEQERNLTVELPPPTRRPSKSTSPGDQNDCEACGGSRGSLQQLGLQPEARGSSLRLDNPVQVPRPRPPRSVLL